MSHMQDLRSKSNAAAEERPGASFQAGFEEEPAMRSVAYVPGVTNLTPLAARNGSPATTRIAKEDRSNGFARPQGVKPPRQSFTVTDEWTGTVDAASWDVKNEDLESVPLDFPLERTHREIHSDATEVAKRISESLQRMSVDAKYERAKAKCKTTECVKFRIRLYAGDENGQPVIVEVQRRSGYASSFMQSCRAILDAAEGRKRDLPDSARASDRLSAVDLAGMKCLQSVEVGRGSEEEAAMAFESASNLVKSEKHDSVVLGLQNLCNLTDPMKTLPGTSMRISQWILFGEQSLREEILSLFQNHVKGDDADLPLVFDQQKHHALIVLANALEMCASHGCLHENVDKRFSWFEDGLLPTLLEVVEDASDNAGCAYIACRSIYSLLVGSSLSLNKLHGIEILEKAHKFGEQTHDLLANESFRCLEASKPSS